MPVLADAPSVWKLLRGVICIFKPPGMSLKGVRHMVASKLTEELNELNCREPIPHVSIEGDTTERMTVSVQPSFSDHPLVVGPRYQNTDIKFYPISRLGFNTSGVLTEIEMKRRADDIVKGDSSGSGAYPPSGGPLSPSRHTPRTLASVQPTYIPRVVKSTVNDLNLGQQYPVLALSANSMPAVNPSIKNNSGRCVTNTSGGGTPLQGSSALASGPFLQGLHSSSRHKMHGGSITTPAVVGGGSSSSQQEAHRLKVEDALSYLDYVKMKFNSQPQVYNEFLDIMKEFKSQSIDTPVVIERVSKLFHGQADLILGFNTFLPSGYKIEVESNGSGFKVQVSMPSPANNSSTTIMTPSVSPIHPTNTVIHSSVIPSNALTANTTPIPAVVSTINKPLIIGNATVLTPGQSAATNCIPASPPPPAPLPMPQSGNQVPVSAASISQALIHYSNHLNANINVDSAPPPSALPRHTSALNNQVDSNVTSQLAVSQPTSQSQPVEFSQSQPVEFDHAINYVNKIKYRFQDQPEIYKTFLEILNTYQKNSGKQLTEAEVYSRVAKLFQNQDDLLAEFGQFLPDATNLQSTGGSKSVDHPPAPKTNPPVPRTKPSLGLKTSSTYSTPSLSNVASGPKFGSTSHPINTPGQSSTPNQAPIVGGKRSSSTLTSSAGPPHLQHSQPKKHKFSFRDVPITDTGKYGALSDYAFFDKVHRSLRNMEVYKNFLRCLVLFNENIVSRSELLGLVSPFLDRQPDLLQWFKTYIGVEDGLCSQSNTGSSPERDFGECHTMLSTVSRQERTPGKIATEIDFATCKRLGASYCAIPKNYVHPKCSGRTSLCREVLNDSWVSFPSWSEDSTFVTSRKTQFEEYIYRYEDERFELDVVIETNLAMIRVLETLHKKLSRMSTEELNKLKLDDCLLGTSPILNQRAVKRLYGDKAPDVMEGLRLQPLTCVPLVLKRLKDKDEEWREAQKGFNKVWRDQNEKFYLKSLDHQGIHFKQNDLKALRSKSLFNEIETLFDERHDQAEEANELAQTGPHMTFVYKDKSVLDDAANLLIHHVRRQTSINKEDKQKIKKMLRQFVPDLFHHPRQDLSEDEREERSCEKTDNDSTSPEKNVNGTSSSNKIRGKDDELRTEDCDDLKISIHASCTNDAYTLFFGNNKWYLFLRLHQILCERLTKIGKKATILINEETVEREKRTPSTAMALRLKPKNTHLVGIEIEEYYPAFLDLVKNVLDGNMDTNTFEDTLREMFGIHAYVAFTLDKVVSYAVRQLQHLVMEESSIQCSKLYKEEVQRGGAGGNCSTAHCRAAAASEAAYQRKAEAALADENCFKITIYKSDCKLTIELLDMKVEGEGGRQNRASQNWNFDRFAESNNRDTNLGVDGEDRPSSKAVFLPRNVKAQKKLNFNSAVPDISPERHSTNPITYEENECTFSLNNYRKVFAVDRENYLHKRNALSRARQIHPRLSQRLGGKFKRWHDQWINEHVDQAQIDEANEWLMGRAPDTAPNFTQILRNNNVYKSPYRSYNRYLVKRIE